MTNIKTLLYRWRFRYAPLIRRVTICRIRGHRLGQIECYHHHGWPFHRPCKRCGIEIGCRYEPLRGIFEYDPNYRHDGRYGIDMLLEEALEAQVRHD